MRSQRTACVSIAGTHRGRPIGAHRRELKINMKPCTLHREPSTLNPTRNTLNPQTPTPTPNPHSKHALGARPRPTTRASDRSAQEVSFFLEAEAIFWPRLSCMCHIGSEADDSVTWRTPENYNTRSHPLTLSPPHPDTLNAQSGADTAEGGAGQGEARTPGTAFER